MNARAALPLLLTLVVHPALAQEASVPNAPAPDPRVDKGAPVRVTTDSGRWSGRLMALSDTSLVVDRDPPLAQRLIIGDLFRHDTLLDRRALRAIEVRSDPVGKKTATIRWGILGGIAGAALGAVTVKSPCPDPNPGFYDICINKGQGAIVGALVGASAGVLVGRFVFGRDRWEPL